MKLFHDAAHALLQELLQENELAAKSEEVLLEALLAWYDHEPEARRPHLATLAAELRCGPALEKIRLPP